MDSISIFTIYLQLKHRSAFAFIRLERIYPPKTYGGLIRQRSLADKFKPPARRVIVDFNADLLARGY
jgi:hypothetical protein